MASTTTGPRYQRTWATPLCLPRSPDGAISAINDQDAGMSAPTARPTRHKPDHDHPGLGAENQPEHAERIEQHVVLVDLLAPEEIAEPSADECADTGGDGIRAECSQQADESGAEVISGRPERQRRGPRHDGAGIDVICKSRKNRVLPILRVVVVALDWRSPATAAACPLMPPPENSLKDCDSAVAPTSMAAFSRCCSIRLPRAIGPGTHSSLVRAARRERARKGTAVPDL